jgi:hypothetical protein
MNDMNDEELLKVLVEGMVRTQLAKNKADAISAR